MQEDFHLDTEPVIAIILPEYCRKTVGKMWGMLA